MLPKVLSHFAPISRFKTEVAKLELGGKGVPKREFGNEKENNVAGGQTYPTNILIILLLLVMILSMFPKNLDDPNLWGYLAFGRLFWEPAGSLTRMFPPRLPPRKSGSSMQWPTGVLF